LFRLPALPSLHCTIPWKVGIGNGRLPFAFERIHGGKYLIQVRVDGFGLALLEILEYGEPQDFRCAIEGDPRLRIPLARSCRRSPEPTCPGLYIQNQ
jgi:hypothetical protein